jgi:hypothetical protein
MNAEMSVERGARTLFRALVAWAAVCYVLSFVSAWWIPTPTDVGAVEYQGYAESRAQFTLPVVVEWGVLALYVPVYVGLWWFKRLARAGLMALVLYTLFSSAFGGDWGGSALDRVLGYAWPLLEGAILALAYVSPVRDEFMGKQGLEKKAG